MCDDLRIGVDLDLKGLAKDHPAQLHAAEELVNDLQEIPGIRLQVSSAVTELRSSKGVLQDLVLAPGTASGAWVVVNIVKLWLARDRRRTINIRIAQDGGRTMVVEASGESLSHQALESAMREALSAYPDGQRSSTDQSSGH
ncbi:MAG TPA: hypothetical protein VMA73_21185 [Streptosporangiaceae bacterium]|nr:hypothetical protein [Streptosporangiaceae bacterium]